MLPFHPNVPVHCSSGRNLADHHCIPECPGGYHPTPYGMEDEVCLSASNQPVSIYDLAGRQISPDNGTTVYLVIPTVPMTKTLITEADSFNLHVWLPVSQSALDKLATGSPYARWTLPRITTEVAALGDNVSTSNILKINPSSVDVRFASPYPLCCRYDNRTIQIGVDIGISCEGVTERLTSIDYANQIAIFSRTQSSPPAGGCPICLSGDTLIDTPNGQVNVKELVVGASIWTVDMSGNRVATVILNVSRTQVQTTHEMVHLVLEDGRQLYVSPGHPTADGRRIGDLKVGDFLDGSRVVTAELVPYDYPYTYDLLPSGDTGFYWANGILVGSTLSKLEGQTHDVKPEALAPVLKEFFQ